MALPASPLSAMGPPSKTVEMEEGVPGIFSKTAEIQPPEIPPMYQPIRSEMPSTGDKPKDIGRNRTTAIVAERPGIDPKMIPTTTPSSVTRRQVGDKITAKIPSSTMKSFLFSNNSQQTFRQHEVECVHKEEVDRDS